MKNLEKFSKILNFFTKLLKMRDDNDKKKVFLMSGFSNFLEKDTLDTKIRRLGGISRLMETMYVNILFFKNFKMQIHKIEFMKQIRDIEFMLRQFYGFARLNLCDDNIPKYFLNHFKGINLQIHILRLKSFIF